MLKKGWKGKEKDSSVEYYQRWIHGLVVTFFMVMTNEFFSLIGYHKLKVESECSLQPPFRSFHIDANLQRHPQSFDHHRQRPDGKSPGACISSSYDLTSLRKLFWFFHFLSSYSGYRKRMGFFLKNFRFVFKFQVFFLHFFSFFLTIV